MPVRSGPWGCAYPARHQQLELDDTVFARSKKLFAKALQGGKQLTRDEMYDVLERAGIATAGQRGYHILARAAQDAFICLGPARGDFRATRSSTSSW